MHNLEVYKSMLNGIIYLYGIFTMPSSALGISRSRMVRFKGLKHMTEKSFTWQGHFAVQLPWCPGLPWKQLPRCHTSAAPQQTMSFSRPDPDLPLTVPCLLTFKEMCRVQGASLKKAVYENLLVFISEGFWLEGFHWWGLLHCPRGEKYTFTPNTGCFGC